MKTENSRSPHLHDRQKAKDLGIYSRRTSLLSEVCSKFENNAFFFFLFVRLILAVRLMHVWDAVEAAISRLSI